MRHRSTGGLAGGQGPAPSVWGDPGPRLFALADRQRLTARCSRSAGFSEVRTEEVGGRFAVLDIDEYVQMTADTAGPIALALRALRGRRTPGRHGTQPFRVGDGDESPCVALCAAAR